MVTPKAVSITVLAVCALAVGAAGADEIGAPDIAAVQAAVEKHNAEAGPRLLREFREFLSLPNISANQADMLANAEWIEAYLARRGFRSETVTAGRAPYVLAERRVSAAAQTILIYAHFDGQPVEPSKWASPPFTPTLKDGATTLDWDEALAGPLAADWRVYARSAGDDKAPVIALMHAIDALDAAGIPIAVNIKLILDGEEEAGSPTLEAILEAHADRLDADLMLFCDGPMHQSRKRQLVFGVRGSATMELTTYGASRPLHSGHYGNWAPHPTDTLLRLLNTLKDESGAILVPGYHDEVRAMTSAERTAIDAMPEIDALLQDELALGRREGGERRIEELVMRPAIVVKGFDGGGVGRSARNIIEPSSTATLNLRLVPNQTPDGARSALERHFKAQGFHLTYADPSAETRRKHPKVLKVNWRGGYRAFRSPVDGAEARALTRLLTRLNGEAPLLTPTMGGSLPIYLFEQTLDTPIIILPIANHDNNQHGRDENIRLANLFDAVTLYAAVISSYRKHRGSGTAY